MIAFNPDSSLSPDSLVLHVRKSPSTQWLKVRFLAIRAGLLCVDDGYGPVWLPFEVDYVHPHDWPRLQEKRCRVKRQPRDQKLPSPGDSYSLSPKLVMKAGYTPEILLVDDEASLRSTLKVFLELSGFQVVTASDGLAALDRVLWHKPDLIVLDVLMPQLDGRETLRRLRQRGDWTPVILLTQVTGTAQRIMAIEEGADDYLNKPFDPQELAVRIKAILRRTQPGKKPLPPTGRLKSHEVVLDRSARRVYVHEREIPLRPKSVSILEYFMTHPDELVTRERLLDTVWGWESGVGERVVDTRIVELRRALKDDPSHPEFIETVPNLGYRYIAPVEVA